MVFNVPVLVSWVLQKIKKKYCSEIFAFFLVVRGLQWTTFFFKCNESCWLIVYRFIWMIEDKILKKKIFPAKIASEEALFPSLVKAKHQHQNFENT